MGLNDEIGVCDKSYQQGGVERQGNHSVDQEKHLECKKYNFKDQASSKQSALIFYKKCNKIITRNRKALELNVGLTLTCDRFSCIEQEQE